MAFQYQPLNTNEIRLLKLIYIAPHTIAFELFHASELGNLQYTALSYTWGPPGDDHDILVNGQRFSIRQNLYDALRRLHLSKLINQNLWIDAICINQGNDSQALKERSIQITLMGQIYERAAKVLVWLGNPENKANNRLAFQMMHRLENRYRNVEKQAHPLRPWLWRPQKARPQGEDSADFMRSILPATDKTIFDKPGSHTYQAWVGIASLWNQPWWTRTWVFQESTIPEGFPSFGIRGIHVFKMPRKVLFVCGDQVAHWPDIYVTVVVAFLILATPNIDLRFVEGPATIVQRLGQFRAKRLSFESPSFLDLLQSFRHTSCLDPRDKIYAPLCLASNEVRLSIRPDYASKTVLDVYTDVVRYHLAQPHSLDFLDYTIHQEEAQAVNTSEDDFPNPPSWVPNFSVKLEVVPIPKVLFLPENVDGSYPGNQEGQIPAFRPLGDLQSRSFIEESALHVSGVCIDFVKDIMPLTGPSLEVTLPIIREKAYQWGYEIGEAGGQYFTGEDFGDVISRTVALDLAYDNVLRPSERGGAVDFALLNKPREETSNPEYWAQTTISSAFQKAMTSRGLGFTEKHYLLLTPLASMAGDIVWALAGGQVLYVLRPVDREMKQYRFIGECYAHGLMDGEIVRRLELGELEMEDLSLV